MLQSEFYERTKVTLDSELYEEVENIYNHVKMDKDEFCKQWLKLRNNKLYMEIQEAFLKRVHDHVADCDRLYNNSKQLKAEFDAYKELKQAELLEQNKKQGDALIQFAKNIIRANEVGDAMVEDVVEQEFGYAFVIKAKHEAGIALSNAEIEYMISKL